MSRVVCCSVRDMSKSVHSAPNTEAHFDDDSSKQCFLERLASDQQKHWVKFRIFTNARHVFRSTRLFVLLHAFAHTLHDIGDPLWMGQLKPTTTRSRSRVFRAQLDPARLARTMARPDLSLQILVRAGALLQKSAHSSKCG